jgi:hypothetical protein
MMTRNQEDAYTSITGIFIRVTSDTIAEILTDVIYGDRLAGFKKQFIESHEPSDFKRWDEESEVYEGGIVLPDLLYAAGGVAQFEDPLYPRAANTLLADVLDQTLRTFAHSDTSVKINIGYKMNLIDKYKIIPALDIHNRKQPFDEDMSLSVHHWTVEDDGMTLTYLSPSLHVNVMNLQVISSPETHVYQLEDILPFYTPYSTVPRFNSGVVCPACNRRR